MLKKHSRRNQLSPVSPVRFYSLLGTGMTSTFPSPREHSACIRSLLIAVRLLSILFLRKLPRRIVVLRGDLRVNWSSILHVSARKRFNVYSAFAFAAHTCNKVIAIASAHENVYPFY